MLPKVMYLNGASQQMYHRGSNTGYQKLLFGFPYLILPSISRILTFKIAATAIASVIKPSFTI